MIQPFKRVFSTWTQSPSRLVAVNCVPLGAVPRTGAFPEGADLMVAENITAVTAVTATDPDAGQFLSYSIAGGADAGLFTINSSTGALSFLELANFENPTDAGGNNVYDVTVQVSDGNGGIDVQAIAVTVQNAIGVAIDGTAANDLIDATHTIAGQPLPTNEENGGKGRDTINGLGGNDTLDGGSNADTMIGGMGDDTYVVDNTSDVVTENAGEGTDTVQSSVTCTLSGNVENLGLTGSGKANGTGNALDNTITGNSGNNVLAGLEGADTLVGGAGNDSLVGGSGADNLTGGSHADTFVFKATADSGPGTQDLITDFAHGTDFIDLRAIDASTSSKGNQAFVFGGHNSNVVAHGVTWFESGGNTFIQADVNGNATADLLIALTGTNHHLTATDFIL